MTIDLRFKRSVFSATAWILTAFALAFPPRIAKAAAQPDGTGPSLIFSTHDGTGGASVHLPSLCVTDKGTVIALCQLRKGDSDDWSHVTDLLVRRSEDGGHSWNPVQVVFADSGINAVNGPIVEDRETHTLILPFTRVPVGIKNQADWIRYYAERGGSVCVMTSIDEGKTWSAPTETKPSSRDGWIAWTGNNCHGVQLANGRLVIPGIAHRVRKGEVFHWLDISVCLLLSDDHGRTWRVGAIGPLKGTGELAIAVCRDGSILASIRVDSRTPHDLVRLMARSADGGESFGSSWLQDNLSINACNVGMIQFVDKSEGTDRFILGHSGPQGGHAQSIHGHHDRAQLTIRLSYDGGRSWPVARLLVKDPKNTEYSDLGVAGDGSILCLYGADTSEKTGSRIELLRTSLDSIEGDSPPVEN